MVEVCRFGGKSLGDRDRELNFDSSDRGGVNGYSGSESDSHPARARVPASRCARSWNEHLDNIPVVMSSFVSNQQTSYFGATYLGGRILSDALPSPPDTISVCLSHSRAPSLRV